MELGLSLAQVVAGGSLWDLRGVPPLDCGAFLMCTPGYTYLCMCLHRDTQKLSRGSNLFYSYYEVNCTSWMWSGRAISPREGSKIRTRIRPTYVVYKNDYLHRALFLSYGPWLPGCFVDTDEVRTTCILCAAGTIYIINYIYIIYYGVVYISFRNPARFIHYSR